MAQITDKEYDDLFSALHAQKEKIIKDLIRMHSNEVVLELAEELRTCDALMSKVVGRHWDEEKAA